MASEHGLPPLRLSRGHARVAHLPFTRGPWLLRSTCMEDCYNEVMKTKHDAAKSLYAACQLALSKITNNVAHPACPVAGS